MGVLPVIPDITHPILSVILKRWVTVEASRSLSCSRQRGKTQVLQLHPETSPESSSAHTYNIYDTLESPKGFQYFCTDKQILTGTFFCVTTTAQSFPLTATDVRPPWLMALKAYSVRDKENVFKFTH